VEVADTSLAYDRDLKVPLYARTGITETWLVDLVNERVEIFTGADARGYHQSRRAGRGERLSLSSFPPRLVLVSHVFGDLRIAILLRSSRDLSAAENTSRRSARRSS